ncbi:MAG: mycothiol system anti-sigma-R factor [Chloroflexota bacterium]
MIDCRTAVEHLYRYLDRDLSEAEMHDIQAHLDQCPPCAKFFRFEAGVLRLVGDACRSTTAPPELRARITTLCKHNPAGQR